MGFFDGIADFVGGIAIWIVAHIVRYWYISLPILFGGIWYYYHKWRKG